MRPGIRFWRMLGLSSLLIGLAGCPQGGSGLPGEVYALGEWVRGSKVYALESGDFLVGGLEKIPLNSGVRVAAFRLSSSFSLDWVTAASLPFAPTLSSPLRFVAPLPGGGAVVAGIDSESVSANSRMRVVSVNDTGNIIWDKIIGESSLVPLMVSTSAFGDILVAGVETTGFVTVQSFLLRLSEAGDVLAFKTCITGTPRFVELLRLTEETVLLAGSTGLPDTSDNDINTIISTISLEAEDFNNQLFDFGKTETVRSLASYPAGGYVLAISDVDGPQIVRLDDAFQVVWVTTDFLDGTVGNESENAWDVAVTPDGLIGVTGTKRRVDYIAQTIPVIREASFVALLDGAGERLWKTNISGTNLYGIAHTAQDTFVATGVTSGGNLHVVEIDMNGNPL